jgi:tRNA(Arg) A34 adenosine deaminase TadA
MRTADFILLQRAIEIAWRARAHGNHPFGALLANEAGLVLLEAENTVVSSKDCTSHAETNLVRMASQRFSREFLSQCSLYTSTEPCAMCAGAIYWAGIGRVVYALSEAELRQMTGNDPENPTLALPCREVFARGQRQIVVEGPFEMAAAREVHQGFWKPPDSPAA